MATRGIKGTKCTSNNTYQVFSTLGIEAARYLLLLYILIFLNLAVKDCFCTILYAICDFKKN